MVLGSATLTVRKRSIAQGPVAISYEVKNGRAVGEMAMGGAPKPIDVQSQKVRVVQLAVTGSETVTVPAGSFDAWKVELTNTDDGQKTTAWIARECRRVAKSTAVVPRMNGAVVTSELQP